MDKYFKSVLTFQEYKIESVDFKLNPKYQPDGKRIKIKFDLDHDICVKKEEKLSIGVIRLVIHIFNGALENNLPFELEVSIVGIFTSSELDDTKFNKMLEVNGTAILFPFLRSTVADITKTANINNLLLPLINVHKFLEQNEQCKIELQDIGEKFEQ